MCRSQAEGGRRCSGGRGHGGGSGGGAPTATAERPKPTLNLSGAPTREDADRLAAEHAARHPDLTDFLTDGPLDAQTRRMYALRDTGWTGGIDQDGYPVAESPKKHAEQPKRASVPSREDADRLAAAYDPNVKGWDGKPLSERDRRMYALRDSGWKGPIDQDGYPTSDDTGPAAGALRRMARDRGENPDW